MSPTQIKKTFDCLEFKRRAQAQIYEEIRRLTPGEQREYFRKGAESGPLGEWWKAVKKLSEGGRENSRDNPSVPPAERGST